MEAFIAVVLLVVGFVLLIKGADWLVEGASSIARKMKVSNLAIGLTVVAFGTSMPELVVNIVSSIQGHNDVLFGNIIGSNLFNLLFILGISGLIKPLSIHSNTVKVEIPISLFAAVLLYLIVNYSWPGTPELTLDRYDAMVLLLLFGLFLLYIKRSMKDTKTEEEPEVETRKTWVSLLWIAVGLVCLVLGGQAVTHGAITIAQYWGLSEKLIGLTIVAAGTSLPELATSAVAAYKGKEDIAVGNIVGSNIFNIFLILGVSGLIQPAGYNPALNFDILVLCAGTILLIPFIFIFKPYNLGRVESGTMLLLFLIYLGYLIYRN